MNTSGKWRKWGGIIGDGHARLAFLMGAVIPWRNWNFEMALRQAGRADPGTCHSRDIEEVRSWLDESTPISQFRAKRMVMMR